MLKSKSGKVVPGRVELEVVRDHAADKWHWCFYLDDDVIKEGDETDVGVAWSRVYSAFTDWLGQQP